MRLEDPRDRQRVAGRLQHHPVRRRQAPREQLQLLRRRRDPPGRARPAALADRDLAEVAMHIQPDRSAHRHLPARRRRQRESGGQNDTYGFALAAHPGKSQGRPATPAGSQPIGTHGLPDRVLPEPPVPERPHDATPHARTHPATAPARGIYMPVTPVPTRSRACTARSARRSRPAGTSPTSRPRPSSSTSPSSRPTPSGSATAPGQPPAPPSRSTSETDSPANADHHQQVASASHTEVRTVSGSPSGLARQRPALDRRRDLHPVGRRLRAQRAGARDVLPPALPPGVRAGVQRVGRDASGDATPTRRSRRSPFRSTSWPRRQGGRRPRSARCGEVARGDHQ